MGSGGGSEPTHDDHPSPRRRGERRGTAVRPSMGRAELQGLSERAFLHQHPWSWVGHRWTLRHSGPAVLGVADPASLGQREQHGILSQSTQAQSPAAHLGYRPGLLGLLSPLLDMAAAPPLQARHASDNTGGDTGNGQPHPNRTHLRKLLCQSVLLHITDWETETQQTGARISQSALPQGQPPAVMFDPLQQERQKCDGAHQSALMYIFKKV